MAGGRPASLPLGRRERLLALAAVACIQLALGAALIFGLRADSIRHSELVTRLIAITLAPPPPPPVRPRPKDKPSSAPKAAPAPGGSPSRRPAPAPPPPRLALHASAPSGGGSASGPATGAGSGGGSGGLGLGADDGEGGTDLVQIAGAITSDDYPRDLRERGIGGRVFMVFTVAPDGRVSRCIVTRSSGVPELDELTCRLIRQRFRYRPSTDRFGRPIADEVEGEHQWIARR